MKILLAGGYGFFEYEEVYARSLESMGVDVIRFSWTTYFKGLIGRIEQRLIIPGWATQRFERDLLAFARDNRPDVIWIWRGLQVRPQLVSQLKQKTGAIMISYGVDDTFNPAYDAHSWFLRPNIWKWFIASIKEYDINFVYRPVNIEEYKMHGAARVELLLPSFIRDRHREVVLSNQEKELYECDIVFVGHYEPDGRDECLRLLVEKGFDVKLWGSNLEWTRNVLGNLYYEKLAPIHKVEGDEYAKALSGAKVCLCFLSKLNRDTYTRRCFEIPACGKVMLAERTDDLLEFFKEDEEACFFSTTEELVSKAQWLIDNPDIRERIAKAGQRRVWVDGHDAESRAKTLLEHIKST